MSRVEALMHVPLWLIFAMVALVFWGITGITQKLSTNAISTELSFLWFGVAMIVLALAVLPVAAPRGHLPTKDLWLAVAGGTCCTSMIMSPFLLVKNVP